MKIGVTIPNNWGVDDPLKVIALGVLAEELGFDSAWTMDHLFNVGFIRTRLEDAPYYHPLGILSFLAARTSRITLGTSVMVLPYHNPVEMAKYAATLDHLSGGRLVLGVGAGGMPEEFEALGVPMRLRGTLTNEAIRLMRELWTSPSPAFHSPRWDFEETLFSPKPRQRPLPVWVGGASDGARRRAALLGDGWHPNAIGVEEYGRGCEEVRRQAAAAGRDPDGIVMSVRLGVEMAPPREEHTPPGRLPADNAAAMVEAVAAYERQGAEHTVLALDGGDIEQLEKTMRMIAAEVLPGVR